MPDKQPFGSGRSFEDVLAQESAHRRARRVERGPAAEKIELGLRPREAEPAHVLKPEPPGPVGLALSGGGIRSATFSLGVLQALADRGMLKHFDYLSTVSGGGYIGTWLSAWIHRVRQAIGKRPWAARMSADEIAREAVETVEGMLAQSAHVSRLEPKQVQWLRRYSNYLTPRVGMLSADALTVVAIWLRNLFLNALILVGLTAAVLLLPIALVPFVGWMISPPAPGAVIAAPLVLPMMLGLLGGGVALGRVAKHLTLTTPEGIATYGDELAPVRVMSAVVLPAFAAAVFGSIWLIANDFEVPGFISRLIAERLEGWVGLAPQTAFGFAVVDLTIGILVLFAISGYYWFRARRALARIPGATLDSVADARVYVTVLIGCLAVTGYLLHYWITRANLYADPATPIAQFRTASVIAPMMTFAPPFMMFVFGIVGSLWVGLVGRTYRESSREWWSRMNGFHIFIGMVWLGAFMLTFYVPPILAYVNDHVGVWATALASATWLGSLAGTFLAKNLNVEAGSNASRWKGIALNIATIIVAVGIFVGLAGLLGYILGVVADDGPLSAERLGDDALMSYVGGYLARIDLLVADGRWKWLVAAIAGLAAIVGILAWRVDINRFSLHNMYKNRLTRCYLGATNGARQPQPFTGFDPADDLPLKDLAEQRPFPIVNTALNLVQGKELAWQQRKAASFVLTPKNCGFDLSQQQGEHGLDAVQWRAYRPTDLYAAKDPGHEELGFSLGMAMATSGAAASPNMGFASTPALAVIMTFFNIRLGRWSPNPIGDKWEQASPKLGLAYLLGELMGVTNEERDFVYLSDGGHFENTAVYELVRRKCALIMVVDAGADPERRFEDLANLQRKVRVDFGYEIDIPLDRLRADPVTKLCGAGFELGTIHYGGARRGLLLVVKPSMCVDRNESADLQNYRAQNPDFPQQTTADQWFNESQFESYRKLGFEIGSACLVAHEDEIVAAAARFA